MSHILRSSRSFWTRILACTALLGLFLAPVRAADPPAPVPAKPPAPKLPKPSVEVLEKVWPGHPEWVAMFVDILGGSQLGPNDGWFRKAVAQTRFGWKPVCEKLDLNHDGKVSRKEFSGTDADFARLDRDRDGALTDADFDFSAHALTPSPGAMLFYRADRDGNGKLTTQELEKFFKTLDRDELGFLSLSDLQEALSPPKRPSTPPGGAAKPEGPTKLTLVRGLFRQEIGSLQPGPKLDEKAPDFTLMTVDSREEITLSKLVGPRPVVLVFGNFTCGPFRSQAGNVEKLYRRYKDRATFVMVYVREAHPTDGWHMESNDRVGVSLAQPREYGERVGVAQTCSKSLGLGMPMLVDTMNDRVGARYSGMPSRLYLIDRAGKVAYKSGRGPFGFKPAELEQSLVMLLQSEPGETAISSSRPQAPAQAQAQGDKTP